MDVIPAVDVYEFEILLDELCEGCVSGMVREVVDAEGVVAVVGPVEDEGVTAVDLRFVLLLDTFPTFPLAC